MNVLGWGGYGGNLGVGRRHLEKREDTFDPKSNPRVYPVPIRLAMIRGAPTWQFPFELATMPFGQRTLTGRQEDLHSRLRKKRIP
ncbi:MAG: hypothetical protein ACM3U2_24635 [Deltaproteobacteria bacterium]